MLAITAAAVIPMIGVIGGAVDISRLYMTRTRMQAACDAGVLAGRKAMSTTQFTDAARTRANNMFNFNFQPADYGATGTSFVPTANAEGKVSATAQTNVPMMMMSIFGFGQQPVNVNCSADIQVPNIDIVLVLDVTGSMNNFVSGERKITSLQNAAKDFYDTLKTALAGNTESQLRFGFVPYSQAVNAAGLFRSSPIASNGEAPLSHLVDTMEVQSRVANFNTAVNQWVPDPSSSPTEITQVFNKDVSTSKEPFVARTGNGTGISTYDCDQYGSNRSFNIGNIDENVWLYPRTYWTGEGEGDSELYQKDGTGSWLTSEPTNATNYYYKLTFERVSHTGSSSYKTCTRRVTKTKYIKQTGYKFTNWTYKPVNYDVSGFKAGTAIRYVTSINSNYLVATAGSYNPVQLAALSNQSGLSSTTTSWDGCIEERTTTAASNFAPIPAAAKDLNFIDGGTSNELRWRPVLRDLTYDRGQVSEVTTTSDYGRPGYTCPSARIRNLNVMTESEFDTYIDSLTPGGYTYLDAGMVWGLRLIAQQGMFSSRNLTGPNGGQISRHIIFLTDGQPDSRGSTYSSYAVEDMAKRITGSTGVDATTLHARRFQALCDAHRGAVSIWAIAFGTSVTGNLTNCADPGRAYQADNTTELETAFRTIASEVADLRLVE